jgi:hypothetical protein
MNIDLDLVRGFTEAFGRRMREVKDEELARLWTWTRRDTRFKSKRAEMVPLTEAELDAIVAAGA